MDKLKILGELIMGEKRSISNYKTKSLFSNPIVVCVLCAFVVLGSYVVLKNGSFIPGLSRKHIHLVTWNMAAINNNPFEYWITHEDPIYNKLMKDVSDFINNPGNKDVPVHEVFTQDMFDDLVKSMKEAGWTDIAEVENQWKTSIKDRKIISQIMKDESIGKKRLASMPDRFTNTINTMDKGALTRPTVINCYSGDLSTSENWWKQWKQFMFDTEVQVQTRKGVKKVKVVELLAPIKKAKYPAITVEEEKISISLQTVYCAVFDSILVHMMNQLEPNKWQPLREDMCTKLNRKKIARSIEILETTYSHADIIFLQEVAGVFIEKAKETSLINKFDVHFPAKLDGDRDQNSLILLKKGVFHEPVAEVTDQILHQFGDVTVPAEDGDLYAILVTSKSNSNYLLASFHGDTNGLATLPVVTAVWKYATSKATGHKMLFGLDANTYEKPTNDQQGVVSFADFYREKELNSCYGPTPNPKNYTTFHARTHLQPQLNKAITLEEKDKKGDKNPKDFILFFKNQFNVIVTHKDNTGKKKYVENMVFPTLFFPSDHGITSTLLEEL